MGSRRAWGRLGDAQDVVRVVAAYGTGWSSWRAVYKLCSPIARLPAEHEDDDDDRMVWMDISVRLKARDDTYLKQGTVTVSA